MADRITGTVKWFNSSKGYGFIAREGGKDVYVTFPVKSNSPTLKEGQRVEFSIEKGAKGRPKATDVNILENQQLQQIQFAGNLTPIIIQHSLAPYLTALTDLQHIIDNLAKRPHASVRIKQVADSDWTTENVHRSEKKATVIESFHTVRLD